MAQIKPRGNQLDIQDIASVVAGDSTASASIAGGINIGDVADVVLMGSPQPVSGDTLVFDGANWLHSKVANSFEGRTGSITATAGDYTASDIVVVPIGSPEEISATDVQSALVEINTEKAALDSPALIGTPTVPTASAGTDTIQIASTSFVQNEKVLRATGTAFPSSPVVGEDFYLTIDLMVGSPVGSPITNPSYLSGSYTWSGSGWISRPYSSTGTNYGWNDYLSPGLSINSTSPSTSPDMIIFRDGISSFAFDPAAIEEGITSIHITHDWVVGSDIWPHIHWAHNTLGSPQATGTVRWGIEYTLADGYASDSFSNTITLYLETTAAMPYVHTIVESSSAIDGTIINIGTIVLMRIFRDATHGNDTFAGDAFLLHVDFHYQTKNAGTAEREPPFTKYT